MLVVHKMRNGMAAPSDSAAVTDVTIWGGESYNRGERTILNLVRRQREHLNKFVFLPQQTRDGRMIRPHYYRSDRMSEMTFPLMRTIGYYEDRPWRRLRTRVRLFPTTWKRFTSFEKAP
jgi:hypothetical protein